MKCIDAIEGTVKCILKQLHGHHKNAGADDSDYIHQVKAVIDATDRYVQKNPEFIQDPGLLKQVLYVYSRNLWLMGQKTDEMPTMARTDNLSSDHDEYQTYYYDYLYKRGVYPS